MGRARALPQSENTARTRVRELTVWGWMDFVRTASGREQCRCVTATASFAAAQRAAEAAGLYGLNRDYVSKTSNKQELAAALAQPGQVFACQQYLRSPDREYAMVVGGRVDE
jgi:hypothetical protein